MATKSWFHKLSKTQQAAYLKAHPKSKYGKTKKSHVVPGRPKVAPGTGKKGTNLGPRPIPTAAQRKAKTVKSPVKKQGIVKLTKEAAARVPKAVKSANKKTSKTMGGTVKRNISKPGQAKWLRMQRNLGR